MENLNQIFFEEYKRLDRLCSDMLCAQNGVTAYINIMDDTPIAYRRFSSDWQGVYQSLKHLRHKRNKLAHETDTPSDFISREDIDCVIWFYNEIMSGNDPLTVIRREYRKLEEQKRQQAKQRQQFTPTNQTQQSYNQRQEKMSFFARLKEKLQNFFKK